MQRIGIREWQPIASPGEFAQLVRNAVENDDVKVVVIDTITGHFQAMPQEQALVT